MKSLVAAAAFALTLAGAAQAKVSLDGQLTYLLWTYPDGSSAFPVGPQAAPFVIGVQISGQSLTLGADGSQVSVRCDSPLCVFDTGGGVRGDNGPINGPTFIFTTFNPVITGVSIDAATTAPVTSLDVCEPALSCTQNAAGFNFAGESWTAGQTAVFDLAFMQPPPGAPEPASWALMVLGLGGVGALLRRRVRAHCG
jgi:hypothetical protein